MAARSYGSPKATYLGGGGPRSHEGCAGDVIRDLRFGTHEIESRDEEFLAGDGQGPEHHNGDNDHGHEPAVHNPCGNAFVFARIAFVAVEPLVLGAWARERGGEQEARDQQCETRHAAAVL